MGFLGFELAICCESTIGLSDVDVFLLIVY